MDRRPEAWADHPTRSGPKSLDYSKSGRQVLLATIRRRALSHLYETGIPKKPVCPRLPRIPDSVGLPSHPLSVPFMRGYAENGDGHGYDHGSDRKEPDAHAKSDGFFRNPTSGLDRGDGHGARTRRK